MMYKSNDAQRKCKEKSILPAGPFTMVVFGGAGDLSSKKLLPALYGLYAAKKIADFSIIALGRTKLSDTKYRSHLKKHIRKADGEIWKEFSAKLNYLSFDASQIDDYYKLCELIHTAYTYKKSRNLIYYLAVQPNLVPDIVNNLGARNLCRAEREAKIIIEKPFGRDRKSAKELNKNLLKHFDERQIYRIDHYLGKETVQNILYFRFSNTIFEPLWNRNYIDHVEIIVAEKDGVGDRGEFYESVGVIRDIVQNHIMQLLCLVAMEPPVDFVADLVRDKKVKVLKAVKSMSKKNIKLGQYESYRQEKNVDPHSKVPTFFEGKFYIDNRRWSKVPFYVKTGKKLGKRLTEINIVFKKQSLKLLGNVCQAMGGNKLCFKIQPQESIALRFNVKKPYTLDKLQDVEMEFDYFNAFKHDKREAYERLLLDCMHSDQTLFARQDEVEETWRIVDPLTVERKE